VAATSTSLGERLSGQLDGHALVVRRPAQPPEDAVCVALVELAEGVWILFRALDQVRVGSIHLRINASSRPRVTPQLRP
jgi:hypothetical protein